MSTKEMTCEEIDQFLTCARTGRLGMVLEKGPYIVPVGFAYANGKVFFHTCCEGLKMETLRKNPNVCFEVDEALSDATMSKSVIIFGKAEIIEDKLKMIPYLQRLIDKYRVPLSFDEYMRRPGRNREIELKAVRICLITPTKVTGRKLLPKEGLHPTAK
jgi:nitroimidazol reductase NimA-like FMN-containing flavoprotein (pyridoxamine 5'-phosphate oxidase superfamily)